MSIVSDLIGDRFVRVITPLGPGALTLERMTSTDELGQPYEHILDLVGVSSDLNISKLLGETVSVQVEAGRGGLVAWHGHVTRAALTGWQGQRARYQLVLSPWLSLLHDWGGSRIFHRKTVPDMIKQIFRERGFAHFEERLEGPFRKWEYAVQYRETDFNFVSRLMEQEGIYYYFVQEATKHTMVLSNSYGSHSPIRSRSTIPYFPPDPTAQREQPHIDAWTSTRQIRPGAYSSTDFDFERPSQSRLRATLKNPKGHPQDNGDIYDHPGEYLEASEGERHVRLRLEELQAAFDVANGHCDVLTMATGGLFTPERLPRRDQNKEHLVTKTEIVLSNNSTESGVAASGPGFSCSFHAMEARTPFRSPFRTPKAVVSGPQTAIVVGPSGEEIWTDKYGRVKVQFHWDREGSNDENSSCWVRVSQAWAGKTWGSMHIPRIGQEVIVDFLEGDPDRPIITGRVYNADNMPPYALPANQTQSGIKSRSTKEGTPDNFNELRFEDKKGEEHVYLQAEKDLQILVKNDESREVGHDRTKDVGHDETTTVGNDRTETVTKNETITIGENRTEDVGKNETITIGQHRTETVTKNETITIGENRTEDVGKNETITIGQSRTVTVGKDETLTTTGKRTTTIKKDDTLAVEGNRTTNTKRNEVHSVDAKMSVTVKEELTIKVGSAALTMKKDGTITLKGKDITIDAGGKLHLKASGDVIIKGSKIAQN